MDTRIVILLALSIATGIYLKISWLVLMLLLFLVFLAMAPKGEPKPKKEKHKAGREAGGKSHSIHEDVEKTSKHWQKKDDTLGMAAVGFGHAAKMFMGFIYGLLPLKEEKKEKKPDKTFKVEVSGKLDKK